MNKPFYNSSEWNFQLLLEAEKHIQEIIDENFPLDLYRNQYEIITSEQMLDAYASVAMPIMYPHWSFGKKFIAEQQKYVKGGGLAYEMVINSNPCINYLLEDNNMTMQLLVMAHAGFGHNHFFKNNYMFKEWTNADSIIEYLIFAKNFILNCEERYGQKEVEKTLDACHALSFHGINKYKRPKKLNALEEAERFKRKQEEIQKSYNELWKTLPENKNNKILTLNNPDTIYPNEENILYFIEKKSLVLKPWQKEIVRITRKIAEYFHPQMETKVMNEGFACYIHYLVFNKLWEKKLISDGQYLEFLNYHTSVVFQPDFADFNPYHLGFNIFVDIERICNNPTQEDKEWFPDLVGKDHKKEILKIVENYKDDSFILQFLSPHLIRELKLFHMKTDKEDKFYHVVNIHNEKGYKNIRSLLSKNYSSLRHTPDIFVDHVNFKGDRVLHLTHVSYNNKELEKRYASKTLQHLKTLWGYDVVLQTTDVNGKNIGRLSTS